MSKRKSKRSRPIPHDIEERISNVIKRAKRRALDLLIDSSKSSKLTTFPNEALLKDISNVLQVDLSDLEKDKIDQESTALKSSKNAKMITSNNSNDQHNETCDVCEKGGDLLCCDTCSLVFHLKCLRPRLNEVPKGSWFCPHCIQDGIADGDVEAAKVSIKAMFRRRRNSDDGTSTTYGSTTTTNEPIDIRELSILRVGRRFILRHESTVPQNGRLTVTDMGRYSSVSAALNGLQRLVEPADRDSETADEAIKGKRSGQEEEDDGEEDELWCDFCLDDASIPMCAFCGCHMCLGKQDSDHLLICDGCNNQFHTYCMTPPLTKVPVGDWFCARCVEVAEEKETAEVSANLEPKVATEAKKGPVEVVGEDGSVVVKHRGRGRPPGRRNKEKGLPTSGSGGDGLDAEYSGTSSIFKFDKELRGGRTGTAFTSSANVSSNSPNTTSTPLNFSEMQPQQQQEQRHHQTISLYQIIGLLNRLHDNAAGVTSKTNGMEENWSATNMSYIFNLHRACPDTPTHELQGVLFSLLRLKDTLLKRLSVIESSDGNKVTIPISS